MGFNGISVEGLKCVFCGSYLFDGDDVVFCPECGAPHHRDCYKSAGHCALAEKHGTPDEYKRPDDCIVTEDDEEIKDNKAKNKQEHINSKAHNNQNAFHTANNENGSEQSQNFNENGNNRIPFSKSSPKVVCRNCNTEFSLSEGKCPNCGQPANIVITPFGGVINTDPLGGVGKNEDINGVPAQHAAQYVALNTARYIPLFKRLNKKSKLSWNWGAFIFPNAWFFYRKIYLPGILFFVLFLTSECMASAINFLISGQDLNTYSEIVKYLTENMATFDKLPLIITALGGFLNLALRIIAGLFGDWFYRTSAITKIKEITNSDPEDIQLELRKKGGINILLGILGLFAIDWLTTLIYYALL